MAMRSFQGVTVAFPASGASQCTQQNWQATNWVTWSTGELRVDAASYALVFLPAGINRGINGKSLGCLTAAACVPVPEPGACSAFVVSTNDPVHFMVRMVFKTAADEEAFSGVVQAAQAVSSSRFFDGNGRRSSMRQTLAMSDGGRAGAFDQLVNRIKQQHRGHWPALVYAGCELYGPDPHGEAGSEVLLGRGAVALLDSEDKNRVGSYEFLFHDEGAVAPILRVPIGPRTRLLQQQEDQSGRLSMGNRLSMAAQGQGVSFEFSAYGEDSVALRFDEEEDALGFARDVCVRQRLALLSLKTSNGLKAVAGLRGELNFVQRSGLVACMRRWVVQVFLLVAVVVLARAAILYSANPERPPLEVVQVALSDALAVASTAGVVAVDACATMCQMLARCVPISELDRCAASPEAADVQDCIIGLAAGGAMGATN